MERRFSSLKIVKQQILRARSSRDRIIQEIRRLEKKVQNSHQEYLQSCRLREEFFRILKNISVKYTEHLEKFKIRLEKSKYSYGAYLLKIIKTYPHIFSLRKPSDLAWNYQNTNTIERIFGILRPRLIATRKLSTLGGVSNYCELFKLYYNTTPRYTGYNNKLSPFEQLKGITTNMNYLDYLFANRARTTLFIGRKKSYKLNIGFSLRALPHRGAILCA